MKLFLKFLKNARTKGLIFALKITGRFIQEKISSEFRKVLFHLRYGPGIDVIQRDWDNLILLDACRYDIFSENTTFEGGGVLSKEISKGDYSWEFMTQNFAGKELHDTIYVSANPYSVRIPEGVFFKFVSLIDEWDGETGTVLPEVVTEKALEITEAHPNKRLIVHYMQPHAPHIGEIGSQLNQCGWNKYHDMGVPAKVADGMSIWEAVRLNQITHEELRQSYLQNFKIVENSVNNLVNSLDGKSVISADHGENLGERKLLKRYYGHSNQTKECRFVPWMELDYEHRKGVKESEPLSDRRPVRDSVNRRLKQLGYL